MAERELGSQEPSASAPESGPQAPVAANGAPEPEPASIAGPSVLPALLGCLGACLVLIMVSAQVAPVTAVAADGPPTAVWAGADGTVLFWPIAVTVLALVLTRYWPWLLLAAALCAVPGTSDAMTGRLGAQPTTLLWICAAALATIGVFAAAQQLARAGRTGPAAALAGLAAGSELLGFAVTGPAATPSLANAAAWGPQLPVAAVATTLIAALAYHATAHRHRIQGTSRATADDPDEPSASPRPAVPGSARAPSFTSGVVDDPTPRRPLSAPRVRTRHVIAGLVAASVTFFPAEVNAARLSYHDQLNAYGDFVIVIRVTVLLTLAMVLIAALFAGFKTFPAAIAVAAMQVAAATALLLTASAGSADHAQTWIWGLIGLLVGAAAALTRWRGWIAVLGAAGCVPLAMAVAANLPQGHILLQYTASAVLPPTFGAATATTVALAASTIQPLSRRGAAPLVLGPLTGAVVLLGKEVVALTRPMGSLAYTAQVNQSPLLLPASFFLAALLAAGFVGATSPRIRGWIRELRMESPDEGAPAPPPPNPVASP